MKDKLTLTVERSAIARAKAYVKREGTSLSQIVEQLFNGIGEKSFVDKWYRKVSRSKARPERSEIKLPSS